MVSSEEWIPSPGVVMGVGSLTILTHALLSRPIRAVGLLTAAPYAFACWKHCKANSPREKREALFLSGALSALLLGESSMRYWRGRRNIAVVSRVGPVAAVASSVSALLVIHTVGLPPANSESSY